MILRARGSLNTLIPQGEEVFLPSVLSYIDSKSCETVVSWQKKFDRLCKAIEDKDLHISKYLIGTRKITAESQLKAVVEWWSDLVFVKKDWSHIDYIRNFEAIVQKVSPEQAKIMRDRNQALAPNKILPNPNRPTLRDLDFSSVLAYLKKRFEEISICVPALLDSRHSPLHEALSGCNMLPYKPEL
jgi:hypothetical protein